MKIIIKRYLPLLVILYFSGCASNDYTFGTGKYGDASGASEMPQQVYVGKPNKFLDASDWYWPPNLLAKLFLWNKNVNSHEVSQKTIDDLQHYLDKNDLQDVQVLVNTYTPGLQFKRLFRNKDVAPGWRYTLGMVSVLSYTIFPGRVFGGDHYNPYTNTISLYSDDSEVAIHEGGHAKDFNSRKYPGINAAIYVIPGAALYYEAKATNDALSYFKHECKMTYEKEGYKTLHPAYGTYLGGAILRQTGGAYIGAIPGHLTGAIFANKVNPMEECLENPQSAEVPITTPVARSSTPSTEAE